MAVYTVPYKIIAGLASAIWGIAEASETCYSLAPAPTASATRMEQTWAPFVAALSEQSGLCFKLVISTSLSEFHSRITLGEPDFGGTAIATQDRRSNSPYEPLVRSGPGRIRGILVVRIDSPVNSVGDLAASRKWETVPVAVASSSAPLSSIEPQRKMRTSGVKCRALEFGTTANTLRIVVLGRAPVGASTDKVLAEYEPAIRKQLKVIFATRPHLQTPIAAHSRVPGRVREEFTRTVIGMQGDDAGRALLRGVDLAAPVGTNLAEYKADGKDLPGPTEGCTPSN